MDDPSEDESELGLELETLASMFNEDELSIDSCTTPGRVAVGIMLQPQTGGKDAASASFVAATLTLALQRDGYPEPGYTVDITLSRTRGLSDANQTSLLKLLHSSVAELSEEGIGCIWTLVDAAREFLSERNVPGECPICLDEVDGSECFRAPCYHCFHRSCVGEWWRRKALQIVRSAPAAAADGGAEGGISGRSATRPPPSAQSSAIGGWHPSRIDVEEAAAELQQLESNLRALDRRCTEATASLDRARVERTRCEKERDVEAAVQARKTQAPLDADLLRAAALDAAVVAAVDNARDCAAASRTAASDAKDGRWAVEKLRASVDALADGWRAVVSGAVRCPIACPVCNSEIPFVELASFAVSAASAPREDTSGAAAAAVSNEVRVVASRIRVQQSELAAPRTASLRAAAAAAAAAEAEGGGGGSAAAAEGGGESAAAAAASASTTAPPAPAVLPIPAASAGAAAAATLAALAAKPQRRRGRRGQRERGGGGGGGGGDGGRVRGGGERRRGGGGITSWQFPKISWKMYVLWTEAQKIATGCNPCCRCSHAE